MKIVFDADRNQKYLEEHAEEIAAAEEKEEGSYSHGERRVRITQITPKEEQELLERYQHAVVQDFEDEYHMTREERDKMRTKFEKFFRLKNGFTKKIRRLDKFVEAWRICMAIINDTAETNGIYDPEEFKRMVYKGDIYINGLNFPKFQGKGKKEMNWEYILEFIMDPDKDINILLNPEGEEDEFENLDLFTDEEIEEILKPLTDEEEQEREGVIFNPEDHGTMVAVKSNKKDRKAIIKASPAYMRTMKNLVKADKSKRRNALIWELDQDDMQYIEEYDAKHNKHLSTKPPVFKGDATNQSDVDAYLYEIEQWEKETTMVEFNGRWITQEELDDIEFKQMLEENGWNLRNLYGNKEKAKRLEKTKKAEKKRIKQLKKMLEEIKERSERRENSSNVYGDTIDKGKSKKSKKKKKKKLKKLKNEILLDIGGVDEDEDIKGYTERMKNMNWR